MGTWGWRGLAPNQESPIRVIPVMIYRLLITAVVAVSFCAVWSAEQVEAGVRGKKYDVEIVTQRPDNTTDVTVAQLRFGPAYSFSGIGNGTYRQLDLWIVSFFITDEFSSGERSFQGIQFYSQIYAVGADRNGNSYQFTGTEVTAP